MLLRHASQYRKAPAYALTATRGAGIARQSTFRRASRTFLAVRLTLEIEGEAMHPQLPGDGAAMVAFMSFAVSRGFGATHPLLALADRLHDAHHVPLGPLTTFYEATPEDAEDREKLELAWQPAPELRAAVERLTAALASDDQCDALVRRAGAESLPDEAAAMIPVLRRAEAAGARVRLSYTL